MDLFRRDDTEYALTHFPESAALDPTASSTPGGRSAGLELLKRANFARYAATRSHLDGRVTRLSPYIRHGLLTLAEVRDAAIARHDPAAIEKLLSELAWRDYYQRLYLLLGDRVWSNLEPYKTGLASDDYAEELPQDIPAGNTGLACIDAFAVELRETGYLHNHARMWVSAYVVHFRRVSWQAGARWFLAHLLDGDDASNNLSWQWVASTFSHKPYFFNRENLERYTDARYCTTCPARHACPFAGEYETVGAKLFPPPHPHAEPPAEGAGRSISLRVIAHAERPAPLPTSGAVVWGHEDALSATHPAYGSGLPTLVTLDPRWMVERGYSFKRVLFLVESGSELVQNVPGAVRAVGDAVELLREFARTHSAAGILIPYSPAPRIRAVAAELATTHRVDWVHPPAFAPLTGGVDLARFSRYWRKIEGMVSRPTGG